MSALPYDQLADWDGKCPECDGAAFIEGERFMGGQHVILTCCACGTRVNQLEMLALGGRKVAQRLKRDDEEQQP